MKEFILIEGGDGSGKTAQSALLTLKLRDLGLNANSIAFPNYDSLSGKVIKEMLNGKYGLTADEVNPYAASMMYAVDRYCAINGEYKETIDKSDVIICNRYTYSNVIHQGAKMIKEIEGHKGENEDTLRIFNSWVESIEFGKMGLPRPTMIFYLHVTPEKSIELLDKRYEGDQSKKDIQESTAFIKKSYESAMICSKICNWNIIECMDGKNIRSMTDIHDDILDVYKKKSHIFNTLL